MENERERLDRNHSSDAGLRVWRDFGNWSEIGRKLVVFPLDFCNTIPYNDVKINYRKGAMKWKQQSSSR